MRHADVLYNNIAHAFFQPAEREALVILHFNLRFPIVVGKRKTVDVQFVQETMEASSRLDARRRNYGDADEIEGGALGLCGVSVHPFNLRDRGAAREADAQEDQPYVFQVLQGRGGVLQAQR